MTTYRMTCTQTWVYDFLVEAEDEDAALEELWEMIGLEGEDLDLEDPVAEDFDVDCRIVA